MKAAYALVHTLDLSAKSPALTRLNLTGLTRPELMQALISSGVVDDRKAKMRVTQLWRWMHHYGFTDFDRMTDIAKEQRALLARRRP